MRRLSGAVLALLWLTGACAGPAPSPAVIASWARSERPPPSGLWQFDPDDEPAGTADDGWVTGRFGDSPSPPRAFCRTATGAAAHPLAAAPPADFDGRVWLRTRVGGDETLGLAFRWVDAAHYYLARVDTRTNNVRLYRRAGDDWSLLDSRDLPVPVDRWHELDVRARGPRLVVGLGGEPLLQADDATYPRGRLALWAGGGSSGCFDDVWLRALPRAADPGE